MNKENMLKMYVGSYTGPEHPAAISLFEWNRETGEIRLVESYADIENASYLALDPQLSRLYAVSETNTFNGQPGGSAAAYAVEPATGRLTKLSQQPTHGVSPCYISLDQAGGNVLVANYMSGNVTVFPLSEDGSLEPSSQVLNHEGENGPNADRQEAPHAHSIVLSPDGRYAIAADLGLDRLMISAIDAQARRLAPHGEAALAPGAGPRHLTYSADQRFVYVVNELNATITVMAYDAAAGRLSERQTVPTLPDDFRGDNLCADIHLSPNGSFLYASNRGHDSIAVYAVNQEDGTLALVQRQSTLGRTPRNFAIAPQGDYLFAANQDTNNIVVFSLDPLTGKLAETGISVEVSKPVCIKFA